MTGLLASTIESIRPLDSQAMAAARARHNLLTKPRGSLGRLEELAVQLAGIQGKPVPALKRKVIITMAGDHGVAVEGVSLFPQEVTAQMVSNFIGDGAGVNVIARQVGARVIVVDMGVAADLAVAPQLLSRKIAAGTRNISLEPAMSKAEAVRAIETGIEVVAEEVNKGLDIVGTGDMGIGNTTASSAICAVMTGEPVDKVTGGGTGIGEKQLAHKIDVINRALAVNKPDPAQPLDVLTKVGGFEIGGLAGVMLGAAAHHIPVVVDGFISGAAALIAVALSPEVKNYMIAAHASVEPGHQLMLRYLGLEPLLALGMRLGEGTGAALGIFLAEVSARVLAEMSTFTEAGVSREDGMNQWDS